LRLLLDTHALIWWLIDLRRLSRSAEAAISDPDNEVLVSAVSAMEVTTKHRLGKLPHVGLLARGFEAQVAAEGFLGLPITLAHAQLAGSMTIQHKDPFDRLLMAQAIAENLTLVSNETPFDASGVARLW
jgi:PIN domain nuclease of toxin-antitoxin system